MSRAAMMRALPMLIVGTLLALPGAYHVRIAWYAYRGVPGFTYDMIPE